MPEGEGVAEGGAEGMVGGGAEGVQVEEVMLEWKRVEQLEGQQEWRVKEE